MRIVVDGVGFQPGGPPAGAPLSLWSALIASFADRAGIDLVLLDRGGMPEPALLNAMPFPPRRYVNSPADSILLQRMCDHLGADVFVSTGFTTPLRTPSVFLSIGAGDSGNGDHEGERALALAYSRVAYQANEDTPMPLAALTSELLRCAQQAIVISRSEDPALAHRWESLRRLQAAVDVR